MSVVRCLSVGTRTTCPYVHRAYETRTKELLKHSSFSFTEDHGMILSLEGADTLAPPLGRAGVSRGLPGDGAVYLCSESRELDPPDPILNGGTGFNTRRNITTERNTSPGISNLIK